MGHQSSLQQAISLTDDILALLDGQNFHLVEDIDSKRQKLIQQVFTRNIDDIDAIKIRYLQQRNTQVVEKLEKLKAEVVLQQARGRTASKLNHAYKNN
ncbi:MAG: hypothetical protein ACI9LO_000869 [Planctomycetota bacterium]|jgi:hypothetical protein